MRRLAKYLWMLALVVVYLGRFQVVAQEASELAALFQQLQLPEKTDSATQQFLKLKANPAAKKYLAGHLPAMIVRGPEGFQQPWNNAVSLAGEFKIAEAAPALAGWISANAAAGTITLGEAAKLANEPAGKALVEIGDPSIPSLADVLAHGSLDQRWNAFYALNLIGSPKAKAALRDHVRDEHDPNLRKVIQRAVQG